MALAGCALRARRFTAAAALAPDRIWSCVRWETVPRRSFCFVPLLLRNDKPAAEIGFRVARRRADMAVAAAVVAPLQTEQ